MTEYLTELVLTALAVLITLTVHEFCHGYAAYKLGDKTALYAGRLTLNPTKHIDPLGALCMLFLHVGWAKPVPVNPRNFKNPRKGFAITALCGPLSNLILAFLFSGIYLLTYAWVKDITFTEINFQYNLIKNLLDFLWIFFTVNIGIAIFNLIPVPPLDGSRILNVILPPKTYFRIMKYERQIYFGLLGWLLLGDYVARAVRSIPLVSSVPALYSLSSVFSLSELLSKLISLIGGLFLDLWQLIPFLNF